ncbi:MAG: ferric reductase-like transmembrane domain-containing protein [Alphaproteobacteria bacterium]|nr:ferric reductase-like transmembrane domain-containing protein [Alphaproteobacteria bacterium]MBU1559332.1 ferric reductase-like transmembrane domain-containing protein [Alphaproteobacteria bacterium]MBU2304637.1 ferric reductase-like transmembrane domain-containing protein [Alphaproteobacteria bacterium]MBU2369976.1 ferric reductase-like transmembrane domain-containing protein [Alphaproteobacteria bacterium]
MRPAHALLIWAGFALAVVVPLTFAATSEYLAWRDPVYIAAGFSGVIALCVALVQPLLAAGWLPGLRRLRGRRVHRFIGVVLVAAVVVHVAGLWITSPPDIEDALLLRSPTPFSVWGVVSMWALFAAALLAVLRRRLSPRVWRIGHTSLVSIVVLGGAIHAMLIEGTMEPISKAVLCGLAIVATAAATASPWLRAR